jgi:hypothetical protein
MFVLHMYICCLITEIIYSASRIVVVYLVFYISINIRKHKRSSTCWLNWLYFIDKIL